MNKIILVILFLLVMLLGCAPVVGSISGKDYEEARTYIQLIPIYTGKVFVFIPYTIYDDEDYILLVKRENGKTERVKVDANTFIKAEIGDYWNEVGIEDKDIRLGKVEDTN